jgi:hypothetical protein
VKTIEAPRESSTYATRAAKEKGLPKTGKPPVGAIHHFQNFGRIGLASSPSPSPAVAHHLDHVIRGMSKGGAHRERDRITIPGARTASPRPPRQFESDFRTSTIFVLQTR